MLQKHDSLLGLPHGRISLRHKQGAFLDQ